MKSIEEYPSIYPLSIQLNLFWVVGSWPYKNMYSHIYKSFLWMALQTKEHITCLVLNLFSQETHASFIINVSCMDFSSGSDSNQFSRCVSALTPPPWNIAFCLLPYLSLSMHLFLSLCLPHINHNVRLSSYFFILCSFLVVSFWILLLTSLVSREAVPRNGGMKPESCRITVPALLFTLHILLIAFLSFACHYYWHYHCHIYVNSVLNYMLTTWSCNLAVVAL